MHLIMKLVLERIVVLKEKEDLKMCRCIKIEDFVADGDVLASTCGIVTIEELGTCFDVNFASILNVLIKEASLCEQYASDLFCDWLGFKKDLRKIEKACTKLYLFGFREMGIDTKDDVLNKANSNYDLEKEYRAIYKLCVEVNEFNTYEESTAKIELYKCRLSEDVL